MTDGPTPEPYFSTVDPPWLALPREVSDVLRPFLPAVVESIINAVPQLVPAYARPIEGRFGRGLRRGVAAVGPFTRFDASRHRTHLAAEVPLADAPPAASRRASWAARFAVAAAREAVAMARLDLDACRRATGPEIHVPEQKRASSCLITRPC